MKTSNIQQGARLRKAIGFFGALMFGIGGMIGGGIFALSGEIALKAGLGAILVFIITGFIALSSGLVYAEFSTRIVSSGGGYSFVYETFPEFLGFVTGWWFFLAYTFAGAFYAEVFGKYLSVMTGVPYIIWSTVLAIMFAIINFIGIKESSIAEIVLTLFKLFLIAFFVLGGLLCLDIIEALLKAEIQFSGALLMIATVFIAFEGFDVIATLSSEMKNPTKDAPKAIISSILIVTSLYILVVIIVLATIIKYGIPSNAIPEEIILYSAKYVIGVLGSTLLGAGAIISTISAYNATLCAASRVGLSMGENRALPRIFRLTHPKTRTPHASIFLSTTIILLLLIGSSFMFSAEEISIVFSQLASLAFAFSFAMVDFSLIIYRGIYGDNMNGFHVPLYPVIPLFGFMSAFIIGGILASFSLTVFLVFLLLTLFGIVFYLAIMRRAKSLEEVLRIIINDFTRAKEALSIRKLIKLERENKTGNP
ncbi:MAG: APC family permease [Candidatus Njordarchaeales archaeon]